MWIILRISPLLLSHHSHLHLFDEILKLVRQGNFSAPKYFLYRTHYLDNLKSMLSTSICPVFSKTSTSVCRSCEMTVLDLEIQKAMHPALIFTCAIRYCIRNMLILVCRIKVIWCYCFPGVIENQRTFFFKSAADIL
jgi:hypothetical protein